MGFGCCGCGGARVRLADDVSLSAADADGDGQISRSELAALMPEATAAETAAIYKALDADGDGIVSAEEYKALDTDGDGKVEAHEFLAAAEDALEDDRPPPSQPGQLLFWKGETFVSIPAGKRLDRLAWTPAPVACPPKPVGRRR